MKVFVVPTPEFVAEAGKNPEPLVKELQEFCKKHATPYSKISPCSETLPTIYTRKKEKLTHFVCRIPEEAAICERSIPARNYIREDEEERFEVDGVERCCEGEAVVALQRT